MNRTQRFVFAVITALSFLAAAIVLHDTIWGARFLLFFSCLISLASILPGWRPGAAGLAIRIIIFMYLEFLHPSLPLVLFLEPPLVVEPFLFRPFKQAVILSASACLVPSLTILVGVYFSSVPWDPLMALGIFILGLWCALWGALTVVALREHERDREIAIHERKAAADLAEANLALQDLAAQAEELATVRERTRVAREIHDTLGHMLTGIIAQLGALVNKVRDKPDMVAGQLDLIRDAAKQGLAEVREAVAVLRLPAKPVPRGREYWTRVADVFAAATGIEVVLRIEHSFDEVTDEINQTVYRTIQEGLTNAVRHGHATAVEVYVDVEDDDLLINISDNGRGSYNIKPGHGIMGIRERASLLGGQVGWRTSPGCGFDLGVDIPMPKELQDEREITNYDR